MLVMSNDSLSLALHEWSKESDLWEVDCAEAITACCCGHKMEFALGIHVCKLPIAVWLVASLYYISFFLQVLCYVTNSAFLICFLVAIVVPLCA
jgi:hypothetical protein